MNFLSHIFHTSDRCFYHIKTLSNDLGLTIAIVLGLLGSKFLVAMVAKVLYHYSWHETLVMWSLSIPQVVATLAAALVGLQVGLINELVLLNNID